jgi:hypothetical protein
MGPWGWAGLVVLAIFSTQSGRACVKKALKSGLRAGYAAKDMGGELAEKAKDYKEELVAEIKVERDEKTLEDSLSKKAAESKANHQHSEK